MAFLVVFLCQVFGESATFRFFRACILAQNEKETFGVDVVGLFAPQLPESEDPGRSRSSCGNASGIIRHRDLHDVKENGDYFIVYWGYIGRMENKMETTT